MSQFLAFLSDEHYCICYPPLYWGFLNNNPDWRQRIYRYLWHTQISCLDWGPQYRNYINVRQTIITRNRQFLVLCFLYWNQKQNIKIFIYFCVDRIRYNTLGLRLLRANLFYFWSVLDNTRQAVSSDRNNANH